MYIYECEDCEFSFTETKHRKRVPFKKSHYQFGDLNGEKCIGKFFRRWTDSRGKAPRVEFGGVSNTGAGRDFDSR